MAVKIRLARKGRKRVASYNIVVADSRAPRDGKFIEKIGNYDPVASNLDVVVDRALYWLLQGAQPTDTTKSLLSKKGVMLKKHLQIGVLKGSISQEQADKKFTDWESTKLNKK